MWVSKVQLGFAGIVVLLWLGALLHASMQSPIDRDEGVAQLMLGAEILSPEAVHEVVYGVPPTVKDATFTTVFLPLGIGNLGTRQSRTSLSSSGIHARPTSRSLGR